MVATTSNETKLYPALIANKVHNLFSQTVAPNNPGT